MNALFYGLLSLIASVGSMVNASNANFNFPEDQQTVRTNLEKFQQQENLFNNTDLYLQELTSSNSLQFNGNEYNIDDITIPVNVFTENAIFTYNGVQESLPSSNIFEKEDERETVTVIKSRTQEVETVTIFNNTSQERIDIIAINNRSGIFATIRDKDIDYDDLQKRFRYDESQDFSNRFLRDEKKNRYEIKSFCTSFRIIKLAIAYDSSFCIAYYGKDRANSKVQEIVMNVSKIYERPDLCIKVKISYLEANCVPKKDPYKEYVDLKKSGCSSYGLLHHVRNIWESGNSHYSYDAMHLFIAKSQDCDEVGCILGCAFVRTLCTQNRYGLDYITFTSSSRLQAMLVAHELGHICGASHEQSNESIMSPIIGNWSMAFSSNSMNSINRFISGTQCIEEVRVTNAPSSKSSTFPSFLPSISPLPTLTIAPSFDPSLSSWPSSKPSRSSSSNPSVSPSSKITLAPKVVHSFEPSKSPTLVLNSKYPSLNSAQPSRYPSFPSFNCISKLIALFTNS